MSDFEYLDIGALLAAREAQHEQTMSGNTGGYQIPLGGMLKRDPYAGHTQSPHCDGAEFCDLDPSIRDLVKR